jgi:hypothetical protein
MTGHFSKYIGLGLAVFFAAGFVSAAWAQDCPPLKKITGVKLLPLANARQVIVPVTINNVPKKFLLDTAGISGFITKESADELKLPHVASSSAIHPVKTFGLGGTIYELPETETNDTTLISPEFSVSPDRDGDIDGTLTNAFLLNKGELDIDFPGGTLNLFSPDHCPGKVNYWGASDIGYLPLSYDILEIGTRERYDFSIITRANISFKNDIAHLTVPVTLDGHPLNGWIDTAAEKSSISLDVAERIFNLQEQDLGPAFEVKMTPEAALGFHNSHDAVKGEIPDRPKVYRHKFSGLTVGHVDIKNLELLIAPERWGRNNDVTRRILYTPRLYLKSNWNRDVAAAGDNRGEFAAYSNAKKDVPDMVLGMDVLRHLHIYLALKEKRMYFSAGATPPPTPAADTAAR